MCDLHRHQRHQQSQRRQRRPQQPIRRPHWHRLKRLQSRCDAASAVGLDDAAVSTRSRSGCRSGNSSSQRFTGTDLWQLFALLLAVAARTIGPVTGSTLDLYRNARLGLRVVESSYGELQGLVLPLDHYKFLRPIEAFLGVPYATPPTGNNRFSPTREAVRWNGIRTADKFSPVCPQRLPNIQNETAALEKMPKGRLEYLKRLLPFLQNQSEDCLYLNIFAPAPHVTTGGSAKKLPVIVFLHGESYEWNGGSPYDGTVLASYGEVVVVTVNYRLGILGFLNANPAPNQRARVANYGLMDQIAALHWVKTNIASFGGDPDMVTLAGHGSGAACINFLMTSPTMVPNLFHRAILLSGSSFSSWALVEEPVVYALQLAREMNCTVPEDLVQHHEQLVDCLRGVKLDDLMAADIQAPTFLSAFGPSVDGVVIRSGQASSNQDEDELSNGRMHSKRSQDASGRYDLMFGVVTSEALWRFSAADIQNGFEGERRDKILRTYVRNAYTYHLSEIFYTVVNEYTDWERTSQHPINTRDAAVAALSDAQFVAPLVHTGDQLAPLPALPGQQKTGPKCYFYVFDYQTKDGDYPQRMGSVHGEDLPYVFGAPLVDGFSHFPRNYTKSEVALSEALMVFWANFARTGNPNEHHRQDPVLMASKERNRFRSIAWEEYDPVHQKFLEIGMKPRMKNHFRAHQLSIWLRLIPELHRAGMEDVIARHNMFKNHDDAELYEGPVKPDLVSRMTFLDGSGAPQRRGNASEYGVTTADPSPLTTCLPSNYTIAGHNNAATTNVFTGGGPNPASNAGGGGGGSVAAQPNASTIAGGGIGAGPDTLSGFESSGYAAYSTALSVTIAIGCSLLILNVLIFAGVYYHRDKSRLLAKTQEKPGGGGGQQPGGGGPGGTGSGCGGSAGGYDPIKHAHYHPGMMVGHSPGQQSGGGNVLVDMEGAGDHNGGMDGKLQMTHICANSMQACMQQQQQQQQQQHQQQTTKVPLGDGVGGSYAIKQQQQHRELGMMGSTATPIKSHGTLQRNNSMYSAGMMTLPKKVGGGGGGGGGGGLGVGVMVQQNTYTRNDCMTLPRNLNSARATAMNGTAEALPNNQPDFLQRWQLDDAVPANIPPRPTQMLAAAKRRSMHPLHSHNQQQQKQQPKQQELPQLQQQHQHKHQHQQQQQQQHAAAT